MKVTVDRFEGLYAIVETEDGQMIDMPRVLTPDGIQEGDVISIIVDKEETERKRIEIQQLKDRLTK